MCTLYSQTMPLDAARLLFELEDAPASNFPPQPAIFPAMTAPVLRREAQGARRLATMSWGFVLPQKGKAPKRVVNARDDKVEQSPFWRGSFEERRCLVPATSFCEPKGRRPAIWHWFALSGATERPPFAFAGIWRRWRGPLKEEIVEMDVFAILTTRPNSLVATVHPDRMPVILAPGDYEEWLGCDAASARALLRPYPEAEMRIVKAGAEKEDGAGLDGV